MALADPGQAGALSQLAETFAYYLRAYDGREDCPQMDGVFGYGQLGAFLAELAAAHFVMGKPVQSDQVLLGQVQVL